MTPSLVPASGRTTSIVLGCEEYHVVDRVFPEIKKTDAGSDEFAAKAKVLKDLIEHHADEEKQEMFPHARKLMDREELARRWGSNWPRRRHP